MATMNEEQTPTCFLEIRHGHKQEKRPTARLGGKKEGGKGMERREVG